MSVCYVLNCKRTRKDLIKNEPAKLYSFPKDPYYKNIWMESCGKGPFNTTSKSICRKHFKKDQFKRNLKHELLNYVPRCYRDLKSTAIPTEHLPIIGECYKHKKSSESDINKSEESKVKKSAEYYEIIESSDSESNMTNWGDIKDDPVDRYKLIEASDDEESPPSPKPDNYKIIFQKTHTKAGLVTMPIIRKLKRP